MSQRARERLERAQWLGALGLLALVQLAFWQASSDPFLPVELLALKVLTPLCVLPLVLGGDAGRRGWALWSGRLLAAWIAWIWIRALGGPYPAEGAKTALEYSLEASLFFLACTASPVRRRGLALAFVGASLVSAAYGLLQHWGADPLLWSTDFSGRPLGTIGNPDFFAGHLVLAWGLCLGWVLAAPKGRWAGPLLAWGLLTLVLVYARTVGAWLGMAVALAVAAAFALSPAGDWVRARRGWTRRGLALCLAAALAIGAAGAALGPGGRALKSFAQEKSLSVVNRTMMWKVALKLWSAAPLQGAGLCSYRPEYPRLQAEILAAEPGRGWNYVVTWLPHENYLYWLCECGIPGLALLLAFWGLSLARGWRGAEQGDGLALAALFASAGLAGVSLLNTFSNIPPTAAGFFLTLGLMAAPSKGTEAADGAAARGRTLEWSALGLALAAALGLQAGRELAANRFLREAGRASAQGDVAEAAALYGRAADLHCANLSPQSLVGVDFNLGECRRKLGQLDSAVASYHADLKVNPWAPEAHNMLGAALGQMGQAAGRRDWVEEGIGHLRTAAWLSPGYTAALLNLGGSYAVLGNVSGAAQAWDEVLRLEPGNEQATQYLKMLKGGR